MIETNAVITEDQTKNQQWFDEFVWSIRADQTALEEGVATEGKKAMYHSLMEKNVTDLVDVSITSARQHYIKSMLLDYVSELVKSQSFPFKKMAVSFNNAELLVWAEIEDDKWDVEKSLIMAEARINSIYHKKGFDMTTTVVEQCDQLPVPSHYQMLYGNK
jgi:hypothetical protein